MANDIDVMLRDYARRWQADQAPNPVPDRSRWTAAIVVVRWVPVLAVAAAVAAVIAGGIVFVRNASSPSPAQPATPSGVVPWQALPPTHPDPGRTHIPESPDPALAEGLPACRATDLHVHPQRNGAGGTSYLVVQLTADQPCKVSGTPAVTPLGSNGQPVDVPVQRYSNDYQGAVAVAPDRTGVLMLGWPSFWCAPPVTIARLAIDLGAGNIFTVDGFGPSTCGAPTGGDGRAPVSVGNFQPLEYNPAREVTVFSGITVNLVLPASVPAGQLLRFTATLTAPTDHDVSLALCPDFSIAVGQLGNQAMVEHALNCAAVPHNAAGVPYLPAGQPVTFAMEIAAPPQPLAAAKVTWQLTSVSNMDNVVGGGTVDVI